MANNQMVQFVPAMLTLCQAMRNPFLTAFQSTLCVHFPAPAPDLQMRLPAGNNFNTTSTTYEECKHFGQQAH
jgi:hypothetical protein